MSKIPPVPYEGVTPEWIEAKRQARIAAAFQEKIIKANEKAFPLTIDHAERKATPITTGVIDYFPNALAEVARISKAGNDQHNPGEPLHWARDKSLDHADCIARHLIERGGFDVDGKRHSAKLAWRALALLQTELEDDQE